MDKSVDGPDRKKRKKLDTESNLKVGLYEIIVISRVEKNHQHPHHTKTPPVITVVEVFRWTFGDAS